MTKNKVIAAIRVLLGKPIARITFHGTTHFEGPLTIEGGWVQINGETEERRG